MPFIVKFFLYILKIFVRYLLKTWKTDELEEILFLNATSDAHTEDLS